MPFSAFQLQHTLQLRTDNLITKRGGNFPLRKTKLHASTTVQRAAACRQCMALGTALGLDLVWDEQCMAVQPHYSRLRMVTVLLHLVRELGRRRGLPYQRKQRLAAFVEI